jgi:hypothetical protein
MSKMVNSFRTSVRISVSLISHAWILSLHMYLASTALRMFLI